MASQADFDAFVESQSSVRELALSDLAVWWSSTDGLAPSDVATAAAEYAPLLSTSYGEVSSVLAADFYDLARSESSGSRGRYAADLAPSEARERTIRQVGWATSPLFSGDRDGALDRLSGVVDAASLQDGRNTLMHNARRDPAQPRWARVPVGKTCAWCLMIASRGARYRTAESAGAGREFHRKCDCQPVPSWDAGADLPPSYDEGALYGLYERARADAGSGRAKDITAAMRRLDNGSLVNDGVR